MALLNVVQLTDNIAYIIGILFLAVVINICWQIVQLSIKKRQDDISLKDFSGPKPHWLMGNLKDTTVDTMLERQTEWAKIYGGAHKILVGPWMSVLRLAMPDTLQKVISTAEPKDPMTYNFIKPWIGDGLLISGGKKWFRNRRLLTPAFHFDILKPYVRIFSQSSIIMVEKWKQLIGSDGVRSIDMFEHVSLHTLDSILKCAFGYESNCQQDGRNNPYIKYIYELSELVTQRFRFPPYHSDLIYYLSPAGYRFRRATRFARAFTQDVVRKRREHLKNKQDANENGVKRKYLDFLDILLVTKDEDGNGLSDQEIQDEVDTFMFEGHDTTASGISWCLYNLANNPECQDKCRQEAYEVIGDREHFSWEDMPKLNYIHMCIKESLRTHPPVANIVRKTTKPVTFPDGRKAPEDTRMGLGIYAVHHNPAVWPDPEKYDPERFSPDNSKNRPPHAYIPFSAGPRNCIGQNFAMNEMKTCIANVVRNFKLEVDTTKRVSKLPEIILRSKGGLWLNVTPV
ncbi:unnamed protein product [Owenia fusiformis]|uniref:Uncharacterized protein n=1 Tax=Owenia fusiformis TaxID=6347 RepID=A0A8J1UH06_OWEFU|nr:unnamed protein product [Owenia fusiformis]